MAKAELTEFERLRMETFRDDLHQQYAIRLSNAKKLIEGDRFSSELLAEAAGALFKKAFLDKFKMKDGLDADKDSINQQKTDLQNLMAQIEIEAGIDDDEIKRGNFWHLALFLANEVIQNSEQRVQLDTQAPTFVPGDPDATDPARGLAGVRGGTDPVRFEYPYGGQYLGDHIE